MSACNQEEEWCRLRELSGVDRNAKPPTTEGPEEAGKTFVQVGKLWRDVEDIEIDLTKVVCYPAYLMDETGVDEGLLDSLNFDENVYAEFAQLRRDFLDIDGRYQPHDPVDPDTFVDAICHRIVATETAGHAYYIGNQGGSSYPDTYRTVYGTLRFGPIYVAYRLEAGFGTFVCSKGRNSTATKKKIVAQLGRVRRLVFPNQKRSRFVTPYDDIHVANPMNDTYDEIHAIWALLLLVKGYDEALDFAYTLLYETRATLQRAVPYLMTTYAS